MKAAIFEKPGIENLQIRHNVEEPTLTDRDVLVRVRLWRESNRSYGNLWCDSS
jgi:hypothetical protein